MQSSEKYLYDAINRPRILAWMMAAVILLVASQYAGSVACLVGAAICFVYPYLVQLLLQRVSASTDIIRRSLVVDALLTGLVVGMVGYSPTACIVLVTMLTVSIVIVAGPVALAIGTPLCFGGAWLTGRYYLTDGVRDLDLVSFACLLVYSGYIAWLVYRETSRLNTEHRREFSLRHELEQAKERLRPFIAPQLDRWESTPQVRRKRLTVFFSDIEGFTHLMDTVDETAVARWLNAYLEAMTKIAGIYGGTVDKFLGDGMMIFFGDPDSDGPVADAYACVSMAVDMRDKLRQMSTTWETGRTIHIRIGIHTGYCLVGSFGCVERMDYTALGSAVNQASRIEGVAGRDEIVISESTFRLLRPWIRVKSLGKVALKGLSAPVDLHRVEELTCHGNGKYLSGRVQLLS
ncbi:MAG: hypothetical protein HOE54_05625 [Gammaproteobacteria bacterium]|jgi:adenylate cyclase|nr:hypothetical protein [Gammaproteobacteria bacterium]